MKILYINVFYEPYIAGGAEITLKNIVEGMKKKGHIVKVVSLWDKNHVKEEKINDIDVIRVPIKNLYLPFFDNKTRPNSLKRTIWHFIESYNPFILRETANIIKGFNPDVVSIHNTQGWSAPVLWKFLYENKYPFIQVLHDQYLLCPTNMFRNNKICQTQCSKCKVLRTFYKKNSKYVPTVVGVSNFILNKLLNYGYFKNAKFKEVIYNARNIKKYNYNINLNNRKTISNDIIYGFIGKLAPNKGIELLLDVFINNSKRENWKLLVAGNGDKDYEDFLKSKYNRSNVKFLGKVHPDEFFPNVDVTVVPSLWEENFPGVIFESLFYGKPVIGSKIGGIPEMINENNGYIFKYNNKEDLYEKMVDFEKKIYSWKEKSDLIQKEAVETYNYDKWLDRWESVYGDVVSAKD
ncbi:glycosyltransferase family 4 protein [Hippea alviniae]|uniref:glycosyltransferase family 4 protein n=1 Tax=Hippea alviniae TaxID=1279027 RepID=UPI0003B77910|nr:glycosyltransferase family 4 protein [Hippea alviniae]